MRRRRHKLEVSTFPFLAVLLCAMGSLILMLLVLDRRAQAAARERAQRAAEQVSAEELRIAEERREEWERRRQALHAELLGQEREIQAKIAVVEGQIAEATTRLQGEQQRRRAEVAKIRADKDQLTRLEQDVRDRQAKSSHANENVQDSEQELRRLTAELKMLERTVDGLKALRQRQANTYSVVPYRGRRGEDRAPLYLECAASGLIFHPDRKVIASPRSAGDAVRSEVGQRVAKQRLTLTAAGRKADATPYLLMLVRPEGISTYYLTLKCLQGLDLDFGYELIDSDWTLEFPDEGDEAKQQPWMVVEKPVNTKPASSMPTLRPIPVPTGIGAAASGAGGTASGNNPSTGTAAAGPVAAGMQNVGGGVNPGQGGGGNGGPLVGTRVDSPTTDNWMSSGGMLGGGSPGAPATLGTAVPGSRPEGVNFGGATENPGRQGGPDPVAQLLGAAGPPNGGGAQLLPNDGWRGKPSPATGGMPPNGQALAGITSDGQPAPAGVVPGIGPRMIRPETGAQTVGAASAGSNVTIPGASAGTEATGAPGGGAPSLGGNSAAPSPVVPDAAAGIPYSPTPLPPPANQQPRGSESAGSDRTGTSENSDNAVSSHSRGGGSGGDAASDVGSEKRPGLRPLDDPTPRPKAAARPPIVRPALLGGDRDYIIYVECKANSIVLHPYGNSFSAESLAPGNGGANLLQEAIGRMIARRQLAVRKGEQPYRPQVRFLVRPDGLRSMHRAYPVLDALHIPLTRQNLDVDEELSFSDN